MNPELVATIAKLQQLRELNLKYNQMLADKRVKYKSGLLDLEEGIDKTKTEYKFITEGHLIERMVYNR